MVNVFKLSYCTSVSETTESRMVEGCKETDEHVRKKSREVKSGLLGGPILFEPQILSHW